MTDKQILERVELYREFDNLIRGTEGYKKFRELLEFRTSFFVYRRNYIDFNNSIKEYYSTLDTLHNNSIKRWYRQRNIIKHIHNVLYSARTLVEKYWKGEVLDDSFHCFMKELRNYITHKNSFPLTSKRILSNGEIRRFETIRLDGFKEYLEYEICEHPKWNGLRLAEAFLIKVESDINLNELLFKYNDKLNEMHKKHVSHHFFINKQVYLILVKQLEDYICSLGENGYTPGLPLTKAQIRYLKMNLKY